MGQRWAANGAVSWSTQLHPAPDTMIRFGHPAPRAAAKETGASLMGPLYNLTSLPFFLLHWGVISPFLWWRWSLFADGTEEKGNPFNGQPDLAHDSVGRVRKRLSVVVLAARVSASAKGLYARSLLRCNRTGLAGRPPCCLSKKIWSHTVLVTIGMPICAPSCCVLSYLSRSLDRLVGLVIKASA